MSVLKNLGFIEMTEPDRPNSKNLKYRKSRQEIVGTVHDAHSEIIDSLDLWSLS